MAVGWPAAQAAGGDRTLYLYYTHTKETGKFTFRKNGKYDPKVLAELNHFLRDWRRNESTKMDPALFDLIWEVYQDVHATNPIYIVSAYRAPATNELLRSKSSGVAKNSRHTQGMAMDFYIPGISLSRLREAAMKEQVGGVGYYPTSGSPFVHLDTGNVRAWPRMTKAQLEKLFPDGETLHLPSGSNTPLSQAGYQLARAEWTKCHTIPCSTRTATSTFAVAQADSAPSAGNGTTLMDWLFGNGETDEAAVDADSAVTPVVVASAPAVPPVPASRPAGLYTDDGALPFGIGSDPLAVAVAAPLPEARPAWTAAPETVTTVASIASAATAEPAPHAQPLPPTPAGVASPLLSAYAPVAAPEPDAQRAVAMILERRAAQKAPDLNTTSLKGNSITSVADPGMLTALLKGTMQAVVPQAGSALPVPGFALRTPALVAPDLGQVSALMVESALVSSARFAIIVDHDQADFSPATELGALAPKLTIGSDPAFGLGRSFFARGTSLLVASR